MSWIAENKIFSQHNFVSCGHEGLLCGVIHVVCKVSSYRRKEIHTSREYCGPNMEVVIYLVDLTEIKSPLTLLKLTELYRRSLHAYIVLAYLGTHILYIFVPL